MIKDYHLMKDVFFTQDDRFFLQSQHRDMICTDTSEESCVDQKFSSSLKKSLSKSLSMSQLSQSMRKSMR